MIQDLDLNQWMNASVELFERSLAVWLSGGWAMLAIAATALVMFTLGVNVWMRLQGKGFGAVGEKTWRSWVHDPTRRRGPIGRIISEAARNRSVKTLSEFFKELRKSELSPFARDLRVMKVCVGAAPLLGLLGTVMGMLNTFGALASGPRGEETMSMIADGISEALITTETGLVIAIPGLFFQYQLGRKCERYRAFLSHLETACAQALYQGILQPSQTDDRKD